PSTAKRRNESSSTGKPAAIKTTPTRRRTGNPSRGGAIRHPQIHHGTSNATVPGARTRKRAEPASALARFITESLTSRKPPDKAKARASLALSQPPNTSHIPSSLRLRHPPDTAPPILMALTIGNALIRCERRYPWCYLARSSPDEEHSGRDLPYCLRFCLQFEPGCAVPASAAHSDSDGWLGSHRSEQHAHRPRPRFSGHAGRHRQPAA